MQRTFGGGLFTILAYSLFALFSDSASAMDLRRFAAAKIEEDKKSISAQTVDGLMGVSRYDRWEEGRGRKGRPDRRKE